MGFSTFGFELCMSGRYAEGERLGRLACALCERHGFSLSRPMVNLMTGVTTNLFSHPVRTSLPYIDAAFRSAQEVGDLLFASFASNWLAMAPYLASAHLDEVLERGQIGMDLLRRAGYTVLVPLLASMLNLVRNLRHPNEAGISLDGPDLTEAHFEQAIEPVTLPVVSFVYHFARLQARYFQGDFAAAAEAASRTSRLLYTMRGQGTEPEAHFFCALALAAGGSSGDTPSEGVPGEIARHRDYLAALAGHCPAGFLSRFALVCAELARLQGADLEALERFEQAIAAAREHGQVQYEALAHELCARFHLARGRRAAARAYLAEARSGYRRWGAEAKVRLLEEQHPDLLVAQPEAFPSAQSAASIDILSASKAAQAISSRVEYEELVETLLTMAREQAGAERAALIVEREGELVQEAQVPPREDPGPAGPASRLPIAPGALPASALRFAWRTAERVVLDGASPGGRFTADPYLIEVRPRSLLCLPIVRRAAVIGLLYLENRQAPARFTPERLAALELIAGQAAISLENAELLRRERAARAASESAEQRAAFLAEASALLYESLDRATVLLRLAQMMVRSQAHWCLIDLVEAGQVRRAAWAHADPALEPLLAQLEKQYAPRWNSVQPSIQVINTGKSLLFPELSESQLARYTLNEDHRRIMRALGTTTALVVPLRARGRALGALTLGSGDSARRLGPSELALAEETATRAAIAIENAGLYRDAQKAVTLREDFLSVASHELNTPLAALMLNLESLMRNAAASAAQPETGPVRTARMAHRQGKRLARLISDLLDVTRIERDQLHLDLQEVELAALVTDAVGRFRFELERANCEVALDLARPVVGRWDPLRLEQVLFNLLANATKFATGAPVEIRLQRQGGTAHLSVTDHGVGIEADNQARIFERFERGVSAAHYGGLGLGLYICRWIADAHGGSIRVFSQPGQGATFTLQLPCSDSN